MFFSSDYGTGAALVEVRAAGNIASAQEVYFTRDMRNHHASSVIVGDHIYGFSSSILTALKFDTGEMAWRNRSVGKGSLIYADERLYLYSEQGTVGLAEATPTEYRERGRFSIKASGPPTWSHPIITERPPDHPGSGHRLCLRCEGEVGRGLVGESVGLGWEGGRPTRLTCLTRPTRPICPNYCFSLDGGTILLIRM